MTQTAQCVKGCVDHMKEYLKRNKKKKQKLLRNGIQYYDALSN